MVSAHWVAYNLPASVNHLPANAARAGMPVGALAGPRAPNGHYLVAVQWHPEVFEATDRNVYNLLRDFIKAAAWLR